MNINEINQNAHMSKFNNWVEDVYVTDTCGCGWCVKIDGCDVYDDINRHGVKTRRSLLISGGHSTEEDARAAAIEWLSAQIELLLELGGENA